MYSEFCLCVHTDHLNKALDIMNQAVSGHFAPGMKENIAYFTHTERRQMDSQSAYPSLQLPGPPPIQSRVGPEVFHCFPFCTCIYNISIS